MASLKNTIVLGLFILAGFGFQTWMQLEHSDRYSNHFDPNNLYSGDYRFDKWTGQLENFSRGKEVWLPVRNYNK